MENPRTTYSSPLYYPLLFFLVLQDHSDITTPERAHTNCSWEIHPDLLQDLLCVFSLECIIFVRWAQSDHSTS